MHRDRDAPNPDAWPYVVGNVHYHWRKAQALVRVPNGWWAVDAETREEAWGPRPRTAARALEDKLHPPNPQGSKLEED